MAQDPGVVSAGSMTAHHEGAIEMAKTQLEYGRNPKMLTWLKKHNKDRPAWDNGPGARGIMIY